MSRPIITLTTDFGVDSHYVAQMKGAMLSVNPDVYIVDMTHGIPAQDIRQGALTLREATGVFPEETIHVAVVDPGVGTSRKLVYVEFEDCRVVCPDNGLLSQLCLARRPRLIIALTESRFWRPIVSSTFHGRDIMGPVAAHLTAGVAPRELGPELETLHDLQWPVAKVDQRMIQGTIVSFDSYGNLITDITMKILKPALQNQGLTIHCNNRQIDGLASTYGSAQEGELVALIGSSSLLELAVVNGNAVSQMGASVGDEVSVHW